MKFSEIKLLTIIISILIITVIWVSYLRPIVIKGDNQFLAMGIIGDNNIENYYVNNDNTEIKFGVENHWNISVTNNMDDIQYLDVKVKILSFKDTLPDSTLLSPSSAITIYDIPFFIAKGDTAYHNFTWSLENPTKIASKDVSIELSTVITINNSKQPIDLSFTTIPLTITNSTHFAYSRIVFELWAFNKNTNSFSFVVETPTKAFCIWNQLFFKVKADT